MSVKRDKEIDEHMRQVEMRGAAFGKPVSADGEDYCPKCHGLILKPNVNYGINPDSVCHCR